MIPMIETSQYSDTYMFIKGFATGRSLPQTLKTLASVKDRKRLDVCLILINAGVDDDSTLAAALLTDVSDQYPNLEVMGIVKHLRKTEGCDMHDYYQQLENDPKAVMIKLSEQLYFERMLFPFNTKEMKKTLEETDLFLLPLATRYIQRYPIYSDLFIVLEYQLKTMNFSNYKVLMSTSATGD